MLIFWKLNQKNCWIKSQQDNKPISIYDCLAKVLYDEERNKEYSPWSCINDDKLQSRIVIAGQIPCLFSVKASLELNSQIAVCMRNTLESCMIQLLVPMQDGMDDILRIIPEYATANLDEQLFFERPYLETAALINEMIGLEYTKMQQTGAIRISEKSGARKDRYTSVSYGNYFIELLEKDLFSDRSDFEFTPLYN